MRISEIIPGYVGYRRQTNESMLNENDIGNGNLINTLETLRFQARNSDGNPMIRVAALIKMMRGMPGSEMFSVDELNTAFQQDNAVKNVIQDIATDENGIKYVHLVPFPTGDGSTDSDATTDAAEQEYAEKTVDSMAKRALKKRS